MYPTKKQILKIDPKVSKKIIRVVNIWKDTYFTKWSKLTNNKKADKLNTLILAIALITNKEIPIIKKGDRYKYNPETKTIYQNPKKPSIISSLHELAHHFYGKSELKACRWSINIFKKCFPKEYKKLEWKGHTLIKRNK